MESSKYRLSRLSDAMVGFPALRIERLSLNYFLINQISMLNFLSLLVLPLVAMLGGWFVLSSAT